MLKVFHLWKALKLTSPAHTSVRNSLLHLNGSINANQTFSDHLPTVGRATHPDPSKAGRDLRGSVLTRHRHEGHEGVVGGADEGGDLAGGARGGRDDGSSRT